MTSHGIDAHTRIIALIGDPVEHSKSPLIQNAALDALGLNVINVALHVRPQELTTVVAGARAAGFLGLMVTIPHKVAALQLADEIDPVAQMLGAANLLHFRSDGRTVAYNTDVYGAEQSLRDHGVDIRGTEFLVLGAGGAARGIVLHFLNAGAPRITIANRTYARALELALEAKSKTSQQPRVIEWNEAELRGASAKTDVVINTTSVGMYPNVDASPLPTSALHAWLVVFDIVYNPIETKLLREARLAGAKTIDGVGMLVYTNERAVDVCCGAKADVALMREVCVRALTDSR